MNLHDLAALVPPIRRLRDQRDAFAAENARLRAGPHIGTVLYPPGHFYSPLPDLSDVEARAADIWRVPHELAGIDLRADQQWQLFAELQPQFARWAYDRPHGKQRYTPDNDYFGHTDGNLLAALLRTVRPRRYVEVGSGWSSALVLDVCAEHGGPDPKLTFVEPHPERLNALLRKEDAARVTVRTERVEMLDRTFFTSLEPDDILFIDSTHVSKIGSDVNFLFFEVLPRLVPGVLVHVHDIAYPFEYPRSWVMEGRAWNESYLLRALLMENPRWEILLWAGYLWASRPDAMRAALGAQARADGGSIWLRRR